MFLGWVLGDVLESTEDGLGYWGSDGDVVTLGLESVLIGGVGQGVGLAIISLVGDATTDSLASVVLVEYLQRTGLFSLSTIGGFEASGKR